MACFQLRDIYEKLFYVNWPMFEKITEKIVQEKAGDCSMSRVAKATMAEYSVFRTFPNSEGGIAFKEREMSSEIFGRLEAHTRTTRLFATMQELSPVLVTLHGAKTYLAEAVDVLDLGTGPGQPALLIVPWWNLFSERSTALEFFLS